MMALFNMFIRVVRKSERHPEARNSSIKKVVYVHDKKEHTSELK